MNIIQWHKLDCIHKDVCFHNGIKCGEFICKDMKSELTCEYDYFQSAEEANWLSVVECQGYHVLKCGHRVPGDYFERPNYCCVCGKRVVEEE